MNSFRNMMEIFSLFSSRDAVVLILSGSHGNLEGRKNFFPKISLEYLMYEKKTLTATAIITFH